MIKRLFIAALMAAGAASLVAAQTRIPPPASARQADARDMALLGYSDLQARSAYQPTIHRQGARYIAYIGHHGGEAMNSLTGQVEKNGTSIVDVTDPRAPRYIAHIPGEQGAGEQGGAQMTRVCSGADLPRADRSKTYLLRSYGNSGHEIWDVTTPEKPTKIVTLIEGLRNTHKNEWECETGIAYIVSGPKDWRVRRMTKIYDLSNPAQPVFIRDFGLHGQQPGTTGTAPTELHGPVSIGAKGNRVYFGYGTARAGIVQIVDREKLLNGPKEPTEANLLYPQIARVDLPPDAGAHTAYPVLGMTLPEFAKQKLPPNAPVPGGGHNHGDEVPLTTTQSHRDFIAVISESLEEECLEPRQMVRMIDITFEDKPIGASTWTVPEASGNFCERGGRFGAHSMQEHFTPIYYGRVAFVTFFNAGLRALDIRDPYNLKEIGHYIPAITDKTDVRCVGQGAQQVCKTAIQSNNVEVDDRGNIFVVDRANTGMHILELTGAARRAANFPSGSN
ncbi:MAG: hypothetical protein FJW14_06060 [Acidimicrobiia bacterium]|nr:hypothetical protein [Acidimicrobiia bacterium]